jgi:hypothetical protein
MIRNKLFLTIVLIILFSCCYALSAGESEADAVYLKMVKEYRLHDDGAVTYHHSHQIKLLTYLAFTRSYGETFIVYDTLFQKLEIERSETTMADGKKVPAPPNAFNKALPRIAENAPAYNHLREMIISHTGLERNAVIDLDYRLETQSGFLPGLMGDEILALNSPINDLTIRIRIPAGKTLRYKLLNSNVKPQERQENGYKIFEWKFTNLPALPAERQQPPHSDFAPHLVFSTIENQQEAFQHITNQEAFKKTENKELAGMVKKMRDEGVSDMDFILALQKKIAQETATFPIAPAVIGFRCRTPQEVWQSNGGTVFEKAVLFAELLRLAGISAQPVLIAGNSGYLESIPVLQSFNQAAVMVSPVDKNPIFLSVDHPVKQNLKYSLNNKTAAILDKGKVTFNTFAEIPANENQCALNGVLKIEDAKNIAGKLNIQLHGAANPYFELLQNKNGIKNLITSVLPGAVVDNTQIIQLAEEIFEAEASVKIEEPFKEQDNYLFWKIPENPQGIKSWRLPPLSIHRATPFKLPFSIIEKINFTITLADGMQLVSPAVNINKDNAAGSLKIKIMRDKNKVTVERYIKLNKQHITVEDYPALLELRRLWHAPNYLELIFKI